MFNVFVQIIISYQWVEYITALTDHNNTFVLYELFLMLCSSVHSDTSERKRKRKRDKTSSAFLPLINHLAVNDKVPLIVKIKEGLFFCVPCLPFSLPWNYNMTMEEESLAAVPFDRAIEQVMFFIFFFSISSFYVNSSPSSFGTISKSWSL